VKTGWANRIGLQFFILCLAKKTIGGIGYALALLN